MQCYVCVAGRCRWAWVVVAELYGPAERFLSIKSDGIRCRLWCILRTWPVQLSWFWGNDDSDDGMPAAVITVSLYVSTKSFYFYLFSLATLWFLNLEWIKFHLILCQASSRRWCWCFDSFLAIISQSYFFWKLFWLYVSILLNGCCIRSRLLIHSGAPQFCRPIFWFCFKVAVL